MTCFDIKSSTHQLFDIKWQHAGKPQRGEQNGNCNLAAYFPEEWKTHMKVCQHLKGW